MKHVYILIFFIAISLIFTGCNRDKIPSDNVTVGDNTENNALEQNVSEDNNITADNSTNSTVTDNNTANDSIGTNTSEHETNNVDSQGTKSTTTKTTTETTGTKTLNELYASRITKYTVNYIVNVNESSDEITQVFDLPKYAIIMKIGNEESRTIFDGTSMYTCSSSEGSWQCFNMATEQSLSAIEENSVKDGTSTSTLIGTCSIAGENGIKYQVTDNDGKKSQLCYTNDGILISMSTADPEYYLAATKITRSIDNSVLILPAEPMDLPPVPNVP